MQPAPAYRNYVRNSVERRARRNQLDDNGSDGAKKISRIDSGSIMVASFGQDL